MLKKQAKEWNIEAPWGNIAMLSWGDATSPPVLMVHGFMDSAASFILLAEHLCDGYHYVAFDFPGHGKSEPLPPGPLVTQGHMVEVIRLIVEHMKWDTFVYLAHSMAAFIGSLYHAVYPGRISKVIYMDPGPSLTPVYLVNYHLPEWYKRFEFYYQKDFGRSASDKPRLYKYDNIVRTMARNRKMSEEQATVVLSRLLVEVTPGLYRLSWEPRIKSISPIPMSEDFVFNLSLIKTIPMLVTVSSIPDGHSDIAEEFINKMINKYRTLNNCTVVNVTGPHDVHITRADKMAAMINEFLNKSSVSYSKL